MAAERCIILAAALAALTGCAGARTAVVADTAAYPISLSRGVRDANGDLVTADRVQKVGDFKSDNTAVGVFYSGATLNPRIDISKAVNAQVARVRGDAIVNLKVKSKACAADFVPVVSLLPLWPGCANVLIEGEIVHVLPPKAVAVVRVGSAGSRLAVAEEVK